MPNNADLAVRKFCSKCKGKVDGVNNVRNGRLYATCNQCSEGAKKRRYGQKAGHDGDAQAMTRITNSEQRLSNGVISADVGRELTPISITKRKRSFESTISMEPKTQRLFTIEYGSNVSTSTSTGTTPDLVPDDNSTCSDGLKAILASTDVTIPNLDDTLSTAIYAAPDVEVLAASPMAKRLPIDPCDEGYQLAEHQTESVGNIYPSTCKAVHNTSEDSSDATIAEDQIGRPEVRLPLFPILEKRSSVADDFMSDAIETMSWKLRRFSIQSSSTRTNKSSKKSLRSSNRSFMSDLSAPMAPPMGTTMDDNFTDALDNPANKRIAARWKVGLLKSKETLRNEMFTCAIAGDTIGLQDILDTRKCSVNDPLSQTLQQRYPGVGSLLELAVEFENVAVSKMLIDSGEVNQVTLARVQPLVLARVKQYAFSGEISSLRQMLGISDLDEDFLFSLYSEAITEARETVVEVLRSRREPSATQSDDLKIILHEVLKQQTVSQDWYRTEALLRINKMMLWERPVQLELLAAIWSSARVAVNKILRDCTFTPTMIAEAILHATKAGEYGPILGRLLLKLPLVLDFDCTAASLRLFSKALALKHNGIRREHQEIDWQGSTLLCRLMEVYCQLFDGRRTHYLPDDSTIDAVIEDLVPLLTDDHAPRLLAFMSTEVSKSQEDHREAADFLRAAVEVLVDQDLLVEG